MNELRGLFFDFDGTIAETERFGQRVAYNRAFADLGLDWHWDEEMYGDLLQIAGGQERIRYYLARYRPDILAGAMESGLVAEAHRAKVRHFAPIAATIPFRPGVERLMREAHQAGIRIGIATTASLAGVEALLAQNPSVRPMIDVIAANESVARKKPAPDVYLWARQQLGLEAHACIALEDSHVGLTAALGAQLTTVVTPSDYTGGEDFTGAAAVLSNLGEPDRSAATLRGAAPRNGYVDVDYLRSVLQARAR